MPEKYSKKELDSFKEKLLDFRATLVENVRHIEEDAHTGENVTMNHLADAGSNTFDEEIAMEQLENEEHLVQAIDDSLKRIEDKSYGVCTQCDKKIPKARLQAIPYAELCIPCQEELEKQGG